MAPGKYMNRIDITPVAHKLLQKVDEHRIGPGIYARFTRGGKKPNPYGCADAANILYSLDRFPKDPAEKAACVAALQGMQDPATGLFPEGSHTIEHTTAHCIAALELFDAKPLYPLKELRRYLAFDRFISLMEENDWLRRGNMAHAGAGIYAALVIAGEADAAWIRRYFDYFNAHCDPETGVWAKDACGTFTRRYQVGDAFHYLFNYDHFHEPIPYPAPLIDTCLSLYRNGETEDTFGRQFHYIEMDWVYCLNRASRATDHRFGEIKSTLAEFAEGYIAWLTETDWDTCPAADDLHLLFGVVCCLAELQKAIPDRVRSSLPLRLTLDRRPFI